jgi:hypothetical protein
LSFPLRLNKDKKFSSLAERLPAFPPSRGLLEISFLSEFCPSSYSFSHYNINRKKYNSSSVIAGTHFNRGDFLEILTPTDNIHSASLHMILARWEVLFCY